MGTRDDVEAVDTGEAVAVAGERVAFDSHGETIVGRLFPAAVGKGPAPGVAILGPMTFQNEQAPTQYAQRLSQLGYASLIFDTRFRGDSGGEPRCYENPAAKVQDLRAAVAYLATRPDVDAGRLAVLGICMGGSHVLPAAADDPLIRSVATVAAHFRDEAADASWLGGEAAVAKRLARGVEARAKYKATGEVDYVPAVDFSRSDAGMPGELVWSWYQLWADRGLWENRYAVMSDAAVFSYDSISAATRLTKPVLMVHSDQCAVPDSARRHFAVVPTADKRLQWEGQTRHLQYYDDPAVIDRTVWSIVDWFSRHLSAGKSAIRDHSVHAVRRFFELLHHKDVETWGELWHEEGRIIAPCPPEGFPTTMAGKQQIIQNFRGLFENFDAFDSELTAIYPAADSDAVCVEYKNRASLVGGTEYTNDNIAVFRFRDGLNLEYHVYFDPRRFQTVVDTLPNTDGRGSKHVLADDASSQNPSHTRTQPPEASSNRETVPVTSSAPPGTHGFVEQ
jgi:ketosteroid isomerase-like protein/dienelactone hydrolase